jgi:hypothetical protein
MSLKRSISWLDEDTPPREVTQDTNVTQDIMTGGSKTLYENTGDAIKVTVDSADKIEVIVDSADAIEVIVDLADDECSYFEVFLSQPRVRHKFNY